MVMNQLKLLLFFSVFLLTQTIDLYGQREVKSREEREKLSTELIEKTPYLFEGIVRNFESFYDKSEEKIYSAYKIEVLHGFKGVNSEEIKWVYVVRPGGIVGNDYQVGHHDPHPNLRINDWYTLLCKENEYINILEAKKGEKIVNLVEADGKYLIRENPLHGHSVRRLHPDGNPKYSGLIKLGFKNFESLNSFLGQVKGVKKKIKK